VRGDGVAKISYSTRNEAVIEANMMWVKTGTPHNPYLCNQRPDHWHVGRGTANLVKER
jgi:hypothetical protein